MSHQKVREVTSGYALCYYCVHVCVYSCTGMKGKMESVAAMKADQIQLDKKLQNTREKLFIVRTSKHALLLIILSFH